MATVSGINQTLQQAYVAPISDIRAMEQFLRTYLTLAFEYHTQQYSRECDVRTVMERISMSPMSLLFGVVGTGKVIPIVYMPPRAIKESGFTDLLRAHTASRPNGALVQLDEGLRVVRNGQFYPLPDGQFKAPLINLNVPYVWRVDGAKVVTYEPGVRYISQQKPSFYMKNAQQIDVVQAVQAQALLLGS